MLYFKSLLANTHDHCCHVVHGDHLVRAKVKHLKELSIQNSIGGSLYRSALGIEQAHDTLNTVIDVCERASLAAVSPHLKLGGVGADLTAEGS